MSWPDDGVVISHRKHGEKYRVVNIFTRENGKASGLAGITSRNTLSQFSVVGVGISNGFWNKKSENQNWARIFKREVHVFVSQSICFILDKILPYGVKYTKVFDYLQLIIQSIGESSDYEIVKLYAYFEFLLLKEIGYGFDFARCSVCGKQEDLQFISPRTGKTASEACCLGFADKLFRIPGIWKTWGVDSIINADIATEELKNSLAITDYFINKHAELNLANYFRNRIISLFDAKQFSMAS